MLPDADALSIDLTSVSTPVDANALTVEVEIQAPPSMDLAAEASARDLFAPVNAAARALGGHIDALPSANSEEVMGGTVYGPVVRCLVDADPCTDAGLGEARLLVGAIDESPFRFRLMIRPVGGTDEDDAGFAAGWTSTGADFVAGQLSVYYDEVAIAVPDSQYAGVLSMGFVRAGEAKGLSYRLSGFRDVSSSAPPSYRSYAANRTADGVTRVRAAEFVDVFAGPRGPELEIERLASHPAHGERSFAVVANWVDSLPKGDVPFESGWRENVWYRRGCKRLDGRAVDEWYLCPSTRPLADCVLAGNAYLSGPVGATWANTCEIANAPAAMAEPVYATFDPNDSAPELGADLAGVSWPAAP